MNKPEYSFCSRNEESGYDMKEEMRCIYCGEEITKEDKVCPNCGTPVESGEKDTGGSDADFNKRIIFAIFIGLVGILSLVLLLTNK